MDIQISEAGLILPVLRERKPKQNRLVALPLSLLRTKLLIPPLPSNRIVRQPLIDLLNKEINNKLTLVSAAAGSGKTTLLSEWARQCSWLVSWVTLDRNDNDPITFWSHVIASLEMAYPGVGEDALSLLYLQQQLRMEAILTILINNLVNIAQELVLIIDDYHVIDTSDNLVAFSIHQAITFLLDHLPTNVHLIIASRVDPPLPLARLRAHRQLVEVRSNELFFTAEETKAFFSQTMNLKLNSHLIEVLEERTEGWIAGLQLVALSLQKCDDISHSIIELTGNHRYILDYLTDEVLCRQPEDVQSFLLQTSILDRLNGPLCDAVTGQSHGQEMLERLERDNLFLLPLDNRQCWYRYHQIFGDFLRHRLKMAPVDQLSVLHRRASIWYEQNHFMFHAIDHALAIPDFPQAIRMITSIGKELMQRNEIVVVQQWLKMLPEDLLHAQPELCLLLAWICIASGQFTIAEQWLQDAEHSSKEEIASSDPDLMIFKQNVLGEVFALQAHIAAFEGNVARTIELANQAIENLSPNNIFLRGLNILNLGLGYWLSGNVNAASQAFSEAVALGETTSNNYVQLIALCGLSHVQIVQGRRHLAFTTSQRALALASERKMELLSVAAYAYVGMGHVLYEWNKLDEAERNLEIGVTLSEQWENSEMFIYGYTALAQVKQAKGKTEQAYEMLQRAEHYANAHSQLSWMTTIMVAQQMRLALAQGHMEIVDRWVQQARSAYVGAFEQITLVRIYIAKGQCIQALEILEQRLQQAKTLEQMGSVIEISILQALAYQKQGDMPKALVYLKNALVLAEPQGYIRLFLDEGEPIEILLSRLLSTHQKKTTTVLSSTTLKYGRMLLTAFRVKAEDTLKEEGSPGKEAQLANAQLTKQECRIVKFLTKGMSSQQIAEQAYISENTVKWYIKKIYSKLHVHNRTQLILQINDLDLNVIEEK